MGIGWAILVFISTNIDDLFLLTILYSYFSSKKERNQVVAGQYVGMGGILALSFVGVYGFSFMADKVIGLMGLLPLFLGITMVWDYLKKKKTVGRIEETKGPWESWENLTGNKLVWLIAWVTIMNGGDNLSIYIPFFSNLPFYQMILAILTFLIMTALWLWFGKKLGTHPIWISWIETFGPMLIPIIFILLGFSILGRSGLLAPTGLQ